MLEAKLCEEEERRRKRDVENELKRKLEMDKMKGAGSLGAPSEAGSETQEEEEQDDTKAAGLEEHIGETVNRADDEAAREAR